MKLLVLYQARDAAQDQPGYYQGFERMVADGQLSSHTAIPFLGVSESLGWDALWDEAVRAATEMGADAIFLQFFHAPMPDPKKGILRLKNLPNKPMIFCSLGDPYGRWLYRMPNSFVVASALSDVSYLTGMGYLAGQLARNGSRNIVLMPHGCCQVRFSKETILTAADPEFDVCFIGSRMRARNPFGHFYRTGKKRQEFVTMFTKRYGKRFGLFGKGWEGNPSWQGPVSYAAQHEAYQRGAVAVGGMPNSYQDFYTSDRPFIATASGVPLVDYRVPGVDHLLVPERDWWLGDSIQAMIALCDRLIEMPSEKRIKMAAETRERILAHHTQYHRCIEMIEIVKSLKISRSLCRKADPPKLRFMVDPSVDGLGEKAVVNWRE